MVVLNGQAPDTTRAWEGTITLFIFSRMLFVAFSPLRLRDIVVKNTNLLVMCAAISYYTLTERAPAGVTQNRRRFKDPVMHV